MRRLSGTPGAAVALVALAAAAGCGGSSGPRAASVGNSPAVTAPGASNAPGARPSAAASSAASASAAATSAVTPAASASTVSQGPGSKPPGTATGFTRAGTYTYDVSGSSTSPLGPTDLAGTDTLAEDPPEGRRQHSTQSGKNGSQELTIEVRPAGLYLDEIKISSQGFNEDFAPSPAVLYFPADYKVGRHWSWSATSTDGKYKLAVTSAVTGTSSVTVGGHAQKALIVDSTLHITGDAVDMTVKQRDWVSTAYALVLKEHATTTGTAYGASFKSDATRVLRSTTPS